MTIEDRIRQFIGDQLARAGEQARLDNLADDADLIENGTLDSLRVTQVTRFLQERFGFAVDDIDVVYGNFHSIAAIANYARGKIGARADAESA